MKRKLLHFLLYLTLPIAAFGQSPSFVSGSISSQGSTCQLGTTYTNCVIAVLPGGPQSTQSAGITITGTWSATLQFEISLDNGANWTGVNATPPNSTTAATSTTANGFWVLSAAGGSQVRVRCSAFTSGSATASVNPTRAVVAGSGGGVATVFNSGTISLPAGNSVIVGCTSTCTVPVPVPTAGYQICVKNNAGVATVITLSALGSSAMYPKPDDSGYGTAGTGTMVSSAAAGNKVCLFGRDATHYELGSVNASANWTSN